MSVNIVKTDLWNIIIQINMKFLLSLVSIFFPSVQTICTVLHIYSPSHKLPMETGRWHIIPNSHKPVFPQLKDTLIKLCTPFDFISYNVIFRVAADCLLPQMFILKATVVYNFFKKSTEKTSI